MSYANLNPKLIECITENFATEKFTDNDAEEWRVDAENWVIEQVQNGTANDFVLEMHKSAMKWRSLTKGQARAILNIIRAEILSADKQADQLIRQITLGETPFDLRNVPSGRYAVKNSENEISFYIIDNIIDPKSKWNGWVFVNILASDQKIRVGSQRPNQTYQGNHENLLREIQKDPFAASVLFGKSIGQCGICGRALTDPESIEMGIGPICAKKNGWGVSEFEAAALRALGFTE